MKKLLVILALPLFVLVTSCGDDGVDVSGTASSPEAACFIFAATYETIGEAFFGEDASVSAETYSCTSGSISIEDNETSGTATFNSCGEPDPFCGTGENIILNGTLYAEEDNTNIKIRGSLRVTGAITEPCGIDVEVDLEGEGDPTGSVCGYTTADLKELEESDFTDYCLSIQE